MTATDITTTPVSFAGSVVQRKWMETILVSVGETYWPWKHSFFLTGLSVDFNNKLVAIGTDYTTASICLYDLTSTVPHDIASSSAIKVTSGPIDSLYTTKEFDLHNPVFFKALTIDFRGQKSGMLNVEFNVDQHGWVQRTVDMSSSYNDIKRSQRLTIGQQGRSIQFRLSNNQPYTNFEVCSIDCEYSPLAENAEITQARAINQLENS